MPCMLVQRIKKKGIFMKKLIVFIIASIGLFANVIPDSDWVTIAAVYIGTQGAIDAIEKLKK